MNSKEVLFRRKCANYIDFEGLKIGVSTRDLYWLLMSEMRYAIKRDNHLAPGTCNNLVKEYLPQMDSLRGESTARQLIEEIIDEVLFKYNYEDKDRNGDIIPLKEKIFHSYLNKDMNIKCGSGMEYYEDWEDLMAFCWKYCDPDWAPYNVERYNQYIVPVRKELHQSFINFKDDHEVSLFINELKEDRNDK